MGTSSDDHGNNRRQTRLLPESYRSQLHQPPANGTEGGGKGGRGGERGARRRRRRRRGNEHHARRRDEDLNSGPTLVRLLRVRSPPRSLAASSVRPSVRGVIIMDVSWGNAPFVDSFTVIIFLLACFTVNFGEHTREEEETGGWERGRGRERERDADVVDHKTGGGLGGPENEQKYDVEQRFPPSATLRAFAITSRLKMKTYSREFKLVLRRGRSDPDATSACFICTFQSPIESTTSLKSPSWLHQFMTAAADPHSPSRQSAERTILEPMRTNERTMSSAKVDS